MDARQVPTFRDARGLRIWAAEAFVGTVSRYESPTVDRVVAVSAEAARGPAALAATAAVGKHGHLAERQVLARYPGHRHVAASCTRRAALDDDALVSSLAWGGN
jgi:hypothetical protein